MTTQVNTTGQTQLTSDQRDKLVAIIKDTAGLLFQQEIIRDQIGEARKLAKDELGIAPKSFNTLLRMFHKDQRDKLEEESMEAIDLYDSLFNKGDN